MDVKEYNLMITNINGIIKVANRVQQAVNKVDTLEDLSIKDLRGLVSDARTALGSQDKVFKSELYHVLNMGKLSAKQTAGFLKKIKELGTYRSTLKFVSTYQIEALPKLDNKPKEAEYKCGTLGIKVSN